MNRASPARAGADLPRPSTTGRAGGKLRRWRRRLFIAAILLLVLLVGGELTARFALGLGDPPLLMADPHIEYLFRPNQDCLRFGNRVHYNAYSMRSDDFPASKTNPAELRVMVIGDSIINGGNPTDQSNLATTLLGPMLSARLNRSVVVGNISAGSWGPLNELAYVQKYGLFDADVVAIVLSSHDVADVPTFGPLAGETEKPICALAEGLRRYSFGDLLNRLKGVPPPDPAAPVPTPATLPADDVRRSLAALRELISMARSKGAKVVVFQHLEQREAQGTPDEGYVLLKSAVEESGVPVVPLGPVFALQLKTGPSPYRDTIHPNELGQKLLAGAMEKAILQVVASNEGVDLHDAAIMVMTRRPICPPQVANARAWWLYR